MRVEHINYGSSLTAYAYGQGGLGFVGTMPSTNPETADVLSAIRSDLGARNQYCLSFPSETNGDSLADYIWYGAGEDAAHSPLLSVTYMVP